VKTSRHHTVSRVGVLSLAAVLALIATPLARADQNDSQVGIEGTDGNDLIDVFDPLLVNASLSTSQGEKLDASATGVDAKAGNDSVTGDAAIDVDSTSSAVLTSDPKETEAKATSVGISGADGDDTVISDSAATATSTSLAAYGNDLAIEHDASNPDKKISVSMHAITDSTGTDTGAGDDTVINSGLVSAISTSTSGGSADQLNATVKDSVSLESVAESVSSSIGVNAGEGSDQVTNTAVINSTATSLSGALALGMVAKDDAAPPPEPGTPAKKTQIELEANAIATATAIGVETESDRVEDSSDDVSPFGVDGLSITYSKTLTTVAGDDTLVNTGLISSLATAASGSGAGAIASEVDGSVVTRADSTATALATGLSTGGGADSITNAGLLDAIATAVADAVVLSLEAGMPPPGDGGEAPDRNNKSSSTTTATANATAVGIDAEGEGHSTTITRSTEITNGTLLIETSTVVNSLVGDDVVNNQGAIVVAATANSATTAAAVVLQSGGSVDSDSTSTADASSIGIHTGGGNDTITNVVAVTSTASAGARAKSASIGMGQGAETPPDGGAAANPDVIAGTSKNSVEASASASAIDAEGEYHNTTSSRSVSMGGGLTVVVTEVAESVQGDDTVNNQGLLTASASATTTSLDASVDIDAVGSLEANASSSADAEAHGIATGGGNDTIDNDGWISSDAAAEATAVAVGLSVQQAEQQTPPAEGEKPDKSNVKVSATVAATADAFGIDAEGSAHDTSRTTTVTIGGSGLTVQHASSTASLAGDDDVTNTGAITTDATATSDARAAGIVIGAEGSVQAEAESQAVANAIGVYTGGGADRVDNEGVIDAEATADASALAVSLSVTQPEQSDTTTDDPSYLAKLKDKFASADANASATATANATGVDAEGGAHATDTVLDIAIDGDGLRVSRTVTETSLAGADTVVNSGLTTVSSTATSGALAADIQVQTEGTASAEANATATASSTGFKTGGGDDLVENSGGVLANAVSGAGALSVSFTQQDGPGAASKSAANATSEATATGIETDGTAALVDSTFTLEISELGVAATFDRTALAATGDDTVVNSGALTANALAGSGAGSGAISIDGAASAEVQSIANAGAVGIATGGGADSVDNTGLLTTSATSAAGALAVGFGQNTSETHKAKLKVAVDAKATANATADGITADAGIADDTIDSELVISADGLGISYTRTQLAFAADDVIDNSGAIGTAATAIAEAAGGAIAIDGAASADVTSTATARAGAIDAGGGDDTVTSTGAIGTLATATAHALSVGFGQKSSEAAKVKVAVEASAVADATATGIRGDSGVDRTTEFSVVVDDAGLETHYVDDQQAVAGADTIVSLGAVAVEADATSGALGAAIAIDGTAKTDIDVTATSRASAIESGGGDDTLSVAGLVAANATSTADAMAAGVGAKSSDTGSARTKVSAETKADAVAIGIGSDAGDANRTTTVDLTIDDGGLDFAFARTTSSGSGDDTVLNAAEVSTNAVASSGTQTVALSIKGAARADAASTAEAKSFAIDAGGGADDVDNFGDLIAVADATATTLSASISTEGSAISNSGLVGGGTEAKSKAVGLSSAGDVHEQSLAVSTSIDFDSIGVTAAYESVTDGLQDGNDIVYNAGEVAATSSAIAAQLEAGITGKGAAVSLGRSEADAYAGAIDLGNGDDTVINDGDLTADSFATAAMANVAVTGKGLAVAANAAWDGGTTAKADAVGINADSGEKVTKTVDVVANESTAQVVYQELTEAAAGNDVIDNRGAVDATAVAIAPSLAVAVAAKGVAAAVSTATAEADATGLRGGHGDDQITNSGEVTSSADATAATANVSVTNSGVAAAADAVWNGGTTAEANAIGIAGDGGALLESTRIAVGTEEMAFETDSIELASGSDTIDNTAAVSADATARALSLGVAVAVQGVGVATASSNAKASASAIDAGAGEEVDFVTNSGDLTADANAFAAAASVSVTNSGLALSADSVWDGGTKADARARGIDVGAGGETITNSGAMNVTADATTASAAVSVAVTGAAGASATSTSTADAVAIDAAAGADGDTVTNDGALTVDSTAFAAGASVSVTNAGLAIAADAVWDGGTGADARARGIDVGDGIDAVTNRESVDSSATAIAASAAVGVAVSGVAGATATSTATADSAAIDLGAGDDDLVNESRLGSVADATAAAATVTVTTAGVAVAADAVWDGGTTADAKARGVAAGSGMDDIDNTGDMSTTANARALSAAVSVAMTGAAGAISTSTAKSDARAIETDSEDDDVFNSGNLDATAYSNAASAAVSFTAAGVAVAGGNVWDGGTKGDARAAAIDLGSGADTLVNEGDLTADAEAHATGISVSVAVEGVAGAITAATAVADAAAIEGGDGDDVIGNSGDLTATSHANANTVSAAGTKFGVSVAGNNAWDGGTHAEAKSAGIRGGTGLDTIDNSGAITSTSTVVAPSVAVAFTVGGVSAAVSTASADAEAKAIDGGEDADIIDNTGTLDATAGADAVAVNVSVAGVGAAVAADAVWDGGTTSIANARGIDGGGGDDMIRNTSLGAEIDTTANSTAVSSSTSISAGGFAGSISTSTATADARALDGGTGNDVLTNESALTSTANADAVSVSVAVVGAGGALASDSFWDGGTKANAYAQGMVGGDGDDGALNSGAIEASASSSTTSTSVAVAAGGGLAGAVVASTSTAEASGMSGDAGDDVAVNQGSIVANTSAEARGVSVSFTPIGVAGAGAAVDAATRAYGTSWGISGGTGDDTLISEVDTTIDLTADASTRETAVAVALQGLAVADANAIATARATGLDGGDGTDLVSNSGALTATVDADSIARSITFTQIGGGIASANATGDAAAVGLDGGQGDDELSNFGSIDLSSNAHAKGQSIGIAVAGAAIAAANADGISDAIGMQGGGGADSLLNAGSIDVATNTTTVARSISANALGVALGTANSTATVGASGMRGGEGDDSIVNTEDAEIDVEAVAEAIATAVTISVAGAADGEARTRPVVTAAGIAGDGGDDAIVNEGSIDLAGRARSFASGTSVTVAGSSSARAGTEVDVELVGIDGGLGADTMVNRGSIEIGPGEGNAWMAVLDVNASSFGFAGGAAADTEAVARTTSIGMDGGDGVDALTNEDRIDVTATALNRSNASTTSIFGSGAAGGQSGAFTHAIGLSGGSATDLLDNSGTLDVSARSRLELTSASYSFAGSGASGGTLAAITEADGMLGGDDADWLVNAGLVGVDARSELTSTGKSEATFGGSSGTTRSGGETRASGLNGGDGDDLIENQVTGSVTVAAQTNVSTQAMSYTFGGGSGNDAILTGKANGVGIDGGDGLDMIVNDGAVDVDIEASLSASGGAETSIGGSKSTGTSVAQAAAIGIDGGADADAIDSSGTVHVQVSAVAEARNSANAVVFAGKAETGAVTRATADATGIEGGAGANDIEHSGELQVAAFSTGYAFGYATGAGFSFNGDGLSRAESHADAFAYGIRAGDDGTHVVNTGDVEVLARATTAKDFVTTVTFYTPPTDADGEVVNRDALDSDDLPVLSFEEQNLTEYPTGTTWFWNKAPVEDDDPNVAAPGAYYQVTEVTVVADDPETEADETVIERQWLRIEGAVEEETIVENGLPTYAAANGNGLDGDGASKASGTARAEATGVEVGTGDDSVVNEGTLMVTAESAAVFSAWADGDAFGDATGTSDGVGIARAWGVDLGGGDDMLVNTGEMLVLATPAAQVRSAVSGGDICITFFFWTWCGGGGVGNGTAWATIEATAIGVAAGEGDDVIINDGLVSVVARPEVRNDPRYGDFVAAVTGDDNTADIKIDVTATAIGIDTGVGDDVVINSGEVRAEAYALAGQPNDPLLAIGVTTGDGNDRIEQYGTIAALTFVNGVGTEDIGIDSGAGNDSLLLGDGSLVIGSVDLGDDDDTLTLMGVPAVEDALGAALAPAGGAGSDLLVLDGPGSFATVPVSFEHARKQGLGTYQLPALNTVQTLTIDQGVLSLSADYAFDPLGSFATYFDTDGDHGELAVTGSSTVGGTIDVEKRGDGFVADGTRHSLVSTTTGVDGAFDAQVLPVPLPLLSFSLEQTPNTVDLVADAASFTTVASTPLYQQIARNLDAVAPSATGDFDTMMGTLQSLNGGFDAAFATLSPDAHFAPEHAASDANMEIVRLLEQHLQSSRAFHRGQLPATVAYGDFSAAFTQQGIAAIGFSTNPMVALDDRRGSVVNLSATAAGSGAVRHSSGNAQAWALGVIGNGDYDALDGYAQFDSDSSAFAIGQDYRFRDDVIVGASLGRTFVDVELDGIGAETDSDGWYGSVYGTWFDERTHVQGGISYATQSFDSARTVTIGQVVRRATGDYDGQSWMAFVGAGHRFGRDAFYAEPFASLYYFDTSLDGFVEQGADSVNQIVEDRDASTLLGEAGVRVGIMQLLERGALDWYATAALNHDFDVDDHEISYAYAGAPGSFFTIDRRDLDMDSTVVGVGVTYLGRRTALSLDYRRLFNSDYEDQALGLRLSYRF